MAPAEVAVSRGLPARKRRNWRRAIVLRFEMSGPLHVIWVMGTSTVSAANCRLLSTRNAGEAINALK